jgi:hypothetical protein
MRELTVFEREEVAGGMAGDIPVLVEGNLQFNFNANSPNTPAADNGLSQPKEHGAFVSHNG